MGAGAVWSYHTVAGPNSEVSRSEMVCPVILGWTGGGCHKELSLVHLQRRTMNHIGLGVASLLTQQDDYEKCVTVDEPRC